MGEVFLAPGQWYRLFVAAFSNEGKTICIPDIDIMDKRYLPRKINTVAEVNAWYEEMEKES